MNQSRIHCLRLATSDVAVFLFHALRNSVFGSEEFPKPILKRDVIKGDSSKVFDRDRKRWKSDGARSEEYDGCGITKRAPE